MEVTFLENGHLAMSIAQSKMSQLVSECYSVIVLQFVYYMPFYTLACMTNDDNSLCVFPFTYSGTTYNECTSADEPEPWCATETSDAGNFISGEFGFCNEHCPVDTSK